MGRTAYSQNSFLLELPSSIPTAPKTHTIPMGTRVGEGEEGLLVDLEDHLADQVEAHRILGRARPEHAEGRDLANWARHAPPPARHAPYDELPPARQL